MITETMNLHLIEESNLFMVTSEENISNNDENNRIKITYNRAIEEIFNLSYHPNYHKYFCQILGEEEQGKSKLLGAAVDKQEGHIFVIVKNQHDDKASVLKRTLDQEWKRVDFSLERGQVMICSQSREGSQKFFSNNYEFSWNFVCDQEVDLSLMDDIYSQNFLYKDASTSMVNWADRKQYLSIQNTQNIFIRSHSDYFQNSQFCYTINYHDIVNKFHCFPKVKNAQSRFDLSVQG